MHSHWVFSDLQSLLLFDRIVLAYIMLKTGTKITILLPAFKSQYILLTKFPFPQDFLEKFTNEIMHSPYIYMSLS